MSEAIGALAFFFIVTAFGVLIAAIGWRLVYWLIRLFGDLYDSWRWRV